MSSDILPRAFFTILVLHESETRRKIGNEKERQRKGKGKNERMNE